jgi:hypothetical protein
MERELLQPETKLELVLTAYEDLERLANEVKQIKSLEHVVTGADFEGKWVKGGWEQVDRAPTHH